MTKQAPSPTAKPSPTSRHFFGLLNSGHKRAAYAWLERRLTAPRSSATSSRSTASTPRSSATTSARRSFLTTYFNMPETDRGNWLRQDGGASASSVGTSASTPTRRASPPTPATTSPSSPRSTATSPCRRPNAPPGCTAAGRRRRPLLLQEVRRRPRRMRKPWPNRRRLDLVTRPRAAPPPRVLDTYFALTPDKRPAYIHAEAEKHGVFVWGALGDNDAHARELDYIRRAMPSSSPSTASTTT
jgi:hypothetical protein